MPLVAAEIFFMLSGLSDTVRHCQRCQTLAGVDGHRTELPPRRLYTQFASMVQSGFCYQGTRLCRVGTRITEDTSPVENPTVARMRARPGNEIGVSFSADNDHQHGVWGGCQAMVSSAEALGCRRYLDGMTPKRERSAAV